MPPVFRNTAYASASEVDPERIEALHHGEHGLRVVLPARIPVGVTPVAFDVVDRILDSLRRLGITVPSHLEQQVAGLEEIDEGEIYIDGKLVNNMHPKDRDVAMVFQSYALYPHMTVYDNMAFALKLRKFPKEEVYGLTSQMRRCAVSIPSNIAEGRRRGSKKDYRHFLIIAYGSGAELETQIEIVKRLLFGKNINFVKKAFLNIECHPFRSKNYPKAYWNG